MKKQLKISLFEQFGETLNTRENVVSLFDRIKTKNITKVTLDFTAVSFISRSFADQLIKEKSQLVDGYSFSYLNANDNVLRMLREVEKTQQPKKKAYKELPVFKFSNQKNIDEYLFSI